MIKQLRTSKNSIKKRIKTPSFHIQSLYYLKNPEVYSQKSIEKRMIFVLFLICSLKMYVNNLTTSNFQEML